MNHMVKINAQSALPFQLDPVLSGCPSGCKIQNLDTEGVSVFGI